MKERVKKRRNFLPALLLGIGFFTAWLLLFLFIPPDSQATLYSFAVLLFFALFFLSSLILGNARRGLFLSVGVLLFMGLGYYGAGTWLNFLLLVGVLVAIEYAF